MRSTLNDLYISLDSLDSYEGIYMMVSVAALCCYVIVHIRFVLMVLFAAHERTSKPGGLAWGTTFTWTLGALILGPFLAVAYWLINETTLRPELMPRPPRPPQPRRSAQPSPTRPDSSTGLSRPGRGHPLKDDPST